MPAQIRVRLIGVVRRQEYYWSELKGPTVTLRSVEVRRTINSLISAFGNSLPVVKIEENR